MFKFNLTPLQTLGRKVRLLVLKNRKAIVSPKNDVLKCTNWSFIMHYSKRKRVLCFMIAFNNEVLFNVFNELIVVPMIIFLFNNKTNK